MKLPVIDQTAWINRGNRPEKVTARAVRIPQSRAATVGGKGVHMEAPGIKAVMTAPRQFKATDLHRENARKDKPAARAPRKRASAEGSVRVWRAAGAAVPAPKRVNAPVVSLCPYCGLKFLSLNAMERHRPKCSKRPDMSPKPRTCHVCGLAFPSRAAWGEHYSVAHFAELGPPVFGGKTS